MPTAYGSIGFDRGTMPPRAIPRAQVRPVATFARALPRPATTLSGTTSTLGVATAGRRVRCYDRATGLLVASVWSDGAGNFTFKGLAVKSDAYLLTLEQVPADGLGTYNVAVFDHVTQS